MKFGVQIEPQFGYDYQLMKEIALEGEKQDFEGFWASDHLFLDSKSEIKNCFEVYTLLTALAVETTKIRLGAMVTCNSYRNPALLAKIASSIDRISNGRLDMGIGAGWKEMEYKAYGYEFPSAPERLQRLEDALNIITKLWIEEKVTYIGKYHSIKDAFSSPKPLQKPYPPIFLGGEGKKITMKLAAKYANYVNLPFTPFEKVKEIFKSLKSHCKSINRDYDDIGKSYFIQIFVGETEDEIENYLIKRSQIFGTSLEQLKKRLQNSQYPGAWIGTPEQVIERIEYARSFDIDYIMIQMPYQNDVDVVRKIGKLILPKFK